MDKEILLYNYFSNQLSDEQRLAFDDLLATDSDFKLQFEFERNLKRAIKNKENENLKEKLISFESGLQQETTSSNKKGSFNNWSIAASVLLLMGLGWIGFNSFSTNYSDLYNSNFQEYPNTVYTITRSDSNESLERDAFVAYESGNYQDALDKFEKIQGPNQYLDFYKAQCYLAVENNTKAIELFIKVEKEQVEFKAEANWYLALTYLKEKDKLRAVEVLKKHQEKYDYNKEKAVSLLGELD